MMKYIEVRYGPLCDDIEVQLNAQGYTLPDHERWEKYREAVNRLIFANLLTESEADRVLHRLNKSIIRAMEAKK